MEPQISVALVTRNRPDSLRRTLESLAAQEFRPFEVVISDDSDEGPAAQTRAVAATFGCRYLVGPRRGLYANRNHVALHCRGTHVRTMDDDHEFPPGHLERCQRAVESDPESVWIIGEYLPGREVPHRPPDCPGELNARGFSSTPATPEHCWAIADGASIYPSLLFRRGIRYAEDFKFGAAYLEFGSRLHWLGYRIRFLDSTYVVHHLCLSSRSYHDTEMNLSSTFFAMLCHSGIYQPGVKNRVLTALETVKQVLLHRGLALKCFRNAWGAFSAHRAEILATRGVLQRDRPAVPSAACG
jgi:glycosyltransferase involved in cell wall biosynthesis